MILKVHDKTYEVSQNGNDYVTQDAPVPADFEGVFTAYVDGEPLDNMSLAGIQRLDDGWHISMYQLTSQELWDRKVDGILNALLGGVS